MLKPHERNDRLAQTREEDRANKGPRHRSRKAEVVICLPEALMDVGRRGAVDENVVYCLQIERLLDLCVRGNQDMHRWKDEYKRCEQGVCISSAGVLMS